MSFYFYRVYAKQSCGEAAIIAAIGAIEYGVYLHQIGHQ